MNPVKLAVGVCALGAVIALGVANKDRFPQLARQVSPVKWADVRDDVLKACRAQKGNTSAFCTCAVQGLEREISPEELDVGAAQLAMMLAADAEDIHGLARAGLAYSINKAAGGVEELSSADVMQTVQKDCARRLYGR